MATKWGTGLKWGAGIKWGAEPQPFDARVEIRDSSGNLKDILDIDHVELSWEYNRFGGCGAFSARLARAFDDFGSIRGDDDVQIKIVKPIGSGFDLWYRGLVLGVEPALGEPEGVMVFGEGYFSRLDKVVVDKTYTATDAGLIARDILDTFVVPNTEITYDAADVPTAGFSADLGFATTAIEALRTIADMLGREWGVREDLKFYMLDPTTTAEHFVRPGGEIVEYRPLLDWSEVLNELIIKGGLVGGSPASFTVSRAGSNPKRQAIVQNSAVTTQAVADKLGGAILDDQGVVKRRASLALRQRRDRIEAAGHPLKRLVVERVDGNPKWGSGIKWGSGVKWGGKVAFLIETIAYGLGDSGVATRLELGSPRPDAAISLGRLERKIEQVAARA